MLVENCIAARIASAAPKRLGATVLLRELNEWGYVGGYGILEKHLARLRPAAVPEPVVRFETAPGEQMQVDCSGCGCLSAPQILMVPSSPATPGQLNRHRYGGFRAAFLGSRTDAA